MNFLKVIKLVILQIEGGNFGKELHKVGGLNSLDAVIGQVEDLNIRP